MFGELEKVRPESRPYFPSFVRCAPPNSVREGPRVIGHWNPDRTGTDEIDENLGRNDFREAISFCCQISAPYFMVRVLKDIRSSEFRPGERAFPRELANKATAGGNSPLMIDRTQIINPLGIVLGVELQRAVCVEKPPRCHAPRLQAGA